jgi:protein-tyrosine phosphatase
MPGMIDIHCHLLPGIDDGAQTLEEALALAQAAVADGISHAVLTPHVFLGRFNNLRSSIEVEFLRFAAFLKVKNVPLQLSFAGEVRLDAEIISLVQRNEIPFLGECRGYRTMLLELPDAQIPLGSITLVRHLMALGIRPVIAHPERNKAVMEKPERIGQFVDAGCFLQITAGSLLGQFGPRVGAATDFLLNEGWVTAVASDAHNLEGRRHRMREAWIVLERRFDSEMALDLMRTGPAALCGIPVDVESVHE